MNARVLSVSSIGMGALARCRLPVSESMERHKCTIFIDQRTLLMKEEVKFDTR